MLMLITRRPWFYILGFLFILLIVKSWIGDLATMEKLLQQRNGRSGSKTSKPKIFSGCDDGKIRGVNLGGWLLLEPWITPSIFEQVNVDNNRGRIYDMTRYIDLVNDVFARDRLNRHYDEFYQKKDLVKLASSGISHLRIPVGFWMFSSWPTDPFPDPDDSDLSGPRFYLKRLVGWADEIGLRIILDLHGAPGSQNGMDHSGRRGALNWNTEGNVGRTLAVIEKMCDMILLWISDGISKETFYGISLLNEPMASSKEMKVRLMEDFYPRAYKAIRKRFDSSLKIIIDSFWDIPSFNGYMSAKDGYEGVILDVHYYHAFGQYWNDMASGPLARIKSWETHKKVACQFSESIKKSDMSTYVGEWSLAVTDCQKYLHGGFSLPYIPPDAPADSCTQYNSDFTTYSSGYKEFLRDFMLSQMEAYESAGNALGWFFWTAKTERHCAPEWDYLFLLDHDIAPKNLCNRTRNVC